MVPLDSKVVFAETRAAIIRDDTAELLGVVDKLSILADKSADKAPVVDKLIQIEEHLAVQGRFQHAIDVCEKAAAQASLGGRQEEIIVNDILRYQGKLPAIEQRRAALGIALRFVDPDSPLEDRIFSAIRKTETEFYFQAPAVATAQL